MNQTATSAVARYLEELERGLKARSGVFPEVALSDACAHLTRHAGELVDRDPGCDEEAVYADFVASFGAPDEVAAKFEETAEPPLTLLPGCAPGWRVFCPQCGRSTPADRVGMVRLGAQSVGKRTLGWCRQCRWFRWFRVERDQDRAELTERVLRRGRVLPG